MGKINDIGQIPGYGATNEKDKAYFQKFGGKVNKQAELIAEQNDIDSETMNAEYDRYMEGLRYNLDEYLVEGAPLTCSMRTMEAQKLLTENGVIMSQPMDVKSMSKLQLIEDRQEYTNGLAYMNITDTRGGFRDKSIDNKGEDEKNDLNIVSFGNCKHVKGDTSLQELAYDLYSKFGLRSNGRTIFEIVQQMEEAIRNGKGTCFCCMALNPLWENLPTEYDISAGRFRLRNELMDGAVTEILWPRGNMCFNGKEGINMMSMLFCRQGGIITALGSGQKEEEEVEEVEKISKEALRTIMELEILNAYSNNLGYLVIEDGKLVGIKPHLVGDNGVTVGFGDYLKEEDMKFYLREDIINRIGGEISKEVEDFDSIKDLVIPVDVCYEKLILDTNGFSEDAIADFKGKGMILTQRQLDAIVIAKYQCYTIGIDAVNEIVRGADREELFKLFMLKHENSSGKFDYTSRTTVEMNIFFGSDDSDYGVEGGLTNIEVEPWNNYE